MTTSVFISTDEAGENMTAYFGTCDDPTMNPMVFPNPADVWPYQRVVLTTDPLYVAYYDTWTSMQRLIPAPGQ